MPPVDDNVALFEQGKQQVDEFVDRRARLDQQHDPARLFEEAHQFLEAVRADDAGPFGFVGQELVDLADRAVVDGDDIAVVVHVQDDVLAHDGQSDKSDICGLRHKRSERGFDWGAERASFQNNGGTRRGNLNSIDS